MPIEILYFGCIGEAGHHLFSKSNSRIRWTETPWGNTIDSKAMGHGGYGRQGLCVTSKKDGWTAVDFTDNSVDTRPGSHSCFLANADIPTEEVLRLAREQWPEVFSRDRFPDLSYQPEPIQGAGNLPANLAPTKDNMCLRIGELERDLASATKMLDWLRGNCRVVFYPPAPEYPVEHTMAAKKDQWDLLQQKAGL